MTCSGCLHFATFVTYVRHSCRMDTMPWNCGRRRGTFYQLTVHSLDSGLVAVAHNPHSGGLTSSSRSTRANLRCRLCSALAIAPRRGVPGSPRRLLLRGASGGMCTLGLTHSDYLSVPHLRLYCTRRSQPRHVTPILCCVPYRLAKARRVSCTEMDRAWGERYRFPKTGKSAVEHTCSTIQ